MRLAPFGRVAVALGIVLLWLVLGGGMDTESALAGLAVAVAIGAWAPLADL